MRVLWCWQRKTELPTLNDEEFRRAMSLKGSGGVGDLWARMFGPVLLEYERITGWRETNINAFYRHRISHSAGVV